MFEEVLGLVRTSFLVGVGVSFVWASWGAGRLSALYLDARLAELGVPVRRRLIVEFGLVLVFGIVLCIVLVDPQTGPQAVAAGMGWTSLVARPTALREG